MSKKIDILAFLQEPRDSLNNHVVCLMTATKKVVKSGQISLMTTLLSNQNSSPNCGCKSKTTCTFSICKICIYIYLNYTMDYKM